MLNSQRLDCAIERGGLNARVWASCQAPTGSPRRAPLARAELRIAQEEQKPYFLLWGRRESMCTRPAGARHTDNMYSWTWQILQEQILATLENARARRVPKHGE